MTLTLTCVSCLNLGLRLVYPERNSSGLILMGLERGAESGGFQPDLIEAKELLNALK